MSKTTQRSGRYNFCKFLPQKEGNHNRAGGKEILVEVRGGMIGLKDT